MPKRKFDDFEDAFSCCREKNYPIIAEIKGKAYKLYPSGRIEDYPLKKKAKNGQTLRNA